MKNIKIFLAVLCVFAMVLSIVGCGDDSSLYQEDKQGYVFKVDEGMGECMFVGVSKSDISEVKIPSEFKGMPVTGVSLYGLYGASIKSVYIPSTVNNIAVMYTSEEYMNFSAGNNLTKIEVDENNEEYRCIDNCVINSFGAVVLGCQNSVIPEDESVSDIRFYAFGYCKGLNSITIPSNISSFVGNPFAGCNELTNIVSENSNFKVVNNCLIHSGRIVTGMKNSVIPTDSEVYAIDDDAFEGITDLKSITIPENIKEISAGAFKGCTGLEKVTFSLTEGWMANEEAVEGLNDSENAASLLTGSYVDDTWERE